MENEFDDVSDDLADLDVDWDQILPFAPHLHNSHSLDPQPESGSPESSVYDFPDVLYDPATLAQIDELEQQALSREPVPAQLGAHITSTVNRNASGAQTSRYFNDRDRTSFPDEQTSTSRRKRRSSSPILPTPSKRSKAICNNVGSTLIEDIEDEFMCPICCDILAVSHAANPCGHSFCASCGEQWILENKNDRCPICRTKLARDNPTIPNITLDNVIEKYIQVLGKSGSIEWTKGGAKFKEWSSRKDAWRQEYLRRRNTAVHIRKYSSVSHGDAYEPPSPPSPRRRRRVPNRRRLILNT